MRRSLLLSWIFLTAMLPAWTQIPAPIPERNVQDAPCQKIPPAAENPVVVQNVPQTQTNQTTMDMRQIKPMAAQPDTPDAPSPPIHQAEDTKTRPALESPHFPDMRPLNFVGPYRRSTLAPLPPGTTGRVQNNLRDGRLYLSLHDAIALAIENNLDV